MKPLLRRARVAGVAVALLAMAGSTTTAYAAPTSVAAGKMPYFVITNPGSSAAVADAITKNGGTVYATYDKIGVTVVHSSDSSFSTKMRSVAGVTHVGATRTSALAGAFQLPDSTSSMREPTFDVIDPATIRGGLAESTEWDMKAIGADKAWATNPGSKDVLVGVIDSGVDDTHEDLNANFDAANSVSCASGRADTTPGSWRVTTSDHGTHVAGTIAAAKNGKGIIGVAPGVRVAAIKIDDPGPKGLLFAENVVCGFMHAAEKKMDVTNNSYYVDPWLFNCPDDPDQAAIAEGVKRAVEYSHSQGVVNVAAAGNASTDLAAEKRVDRTSPNDSTPKSRTITNKCVTVPTEIPGVAVVSASTSRSKKASFSNYGLGQIDVTSPGEGIRSTIPGNRYGSKSGTSMASPHVAGVMALLKSAHKDATPAQLLEMLRKQATDWSCRTHGDRNCTGPDNDNSYFGEGLSNAAAAVQP